MAGKGSMYGDLDAAIRLVAAARNGFAGIPSARVESESRSAEDCLLNPEYSASGPADH